MLVELRVCIGHAAGTHRQLWCRAAAAALCDTAHKANLGSEQPALRLLWRLLLQHARRCLWAHALAE